MIKINKYLILFSFFLILNCSFGDKAGIWTGSEDIKRQTSEIEANQKKNNKVFKIYTNLDTYKTEKTADYKVKLSDPKKSLFWKSSNLNAQNFVGHNLLASIENNFLKKKIGKNRFNTLQTSSSPLVFNNYIFLTDDTGSIFKINENGKIIWKKNIYGKNFKKIFKKITFAIYETQILVSDNIGFVYSISLLDGKIIWIKNHGIPFKSIIKVFDNKIFLINQDNRLLCFDIDKGNKIWDVRSVSSFIRSQSFLSLSLSTKGNVVILNSSGDLISVNAKNGRVIWYVNTLSASSLADTNFLKFSNIAITDNELFFSTISSTYSFTLNNGYQNWKVDIGSESTPIIDGNNVFLVTNNGYFVNLDRNSGKMIWSTHLFKILKKRKQNTKVVGFVLGSKKIYVLTLNGYLIVSSADTGKVLSFKKIAGEINSPPIISNGSLFVLTANSKILGFN